MSTKACGFCGKPDCTKKFEHWALILGIKVYNDALAEGASDSEFEQRIGAAIADAYLKGFAAGAQTLEQRLGA